MKTSFLKIFCLVAIIAVVPLAKTSAATNQASVDLLFQSFSYTPPFYEGKALNGSQGSMVVTAFPEFFDENGYKLKTTELIFNWKKDGIVAQSLSGLGKNYLAFYGSVPVRDVKIEVSVSSANKKLSADGSINITTYSPKIIFYENSPIYGLLFNRAIRTTVNMASDEFTAAAMPYFFNVKYAASPDLDYAWSMNSKTVANQDIKNEFTAKIVNETSGLANIALKIANSSRIFQFSDNSFNINFNKQ